MPAEDTGTVEVTRDGDVAVVTLRRERKRNALSTHMENELLRRVAQPGGRSPAEPSSSPAATRCSRPARTSPNCAT